VRDLKSFIRQLKPSGSSPALPAPGLYHYSKENGAEKSRIHLRIDPDQRSILLVNASRIVHLNPTATLMAYLVLQQTNQEQAIRWISGLYKVSKSQVVNDYTQMAERVDELVRPDGACPIHELDLDVIAPFSSQPSAPYRMDLAITYRCNNNCSHCYNARPRSYPELNTDQWISILDRVWASGIPHVVFTGGEPTLRADLPDLIAHAELNGQITGLNTNGRRLADNSFVQDLVKAGLDHVQITLESHDPDIHNEMVDSTQAWEQTVAGLRNVLATSMYVMTNTTMLRPNSPYLEKTLDFLAELGVPTVGLNALIYSGRGLDVDSGLEEEELHPLLKLATNLTTARGQRLIWYTPTEYCRFDPVQMELGVKGCTAARYNMCIESNGDVIPCQSFYQSVGNILQDSWESIWDHEICHKLREHSMIQVKCQSCALLAECGGSCPLRSMALSI